MISLNLNCIMQLKQLYNIATKVSSRKLCYNVWWSTWMVKGNIFIRIVLLGYSQTQTRGALLSTYQYFDLELVDDLLISLEYGVCKTKHFAQNGITFLHSTTKGKNMLHNYTTWKKSNQFLFIALEHRTHQSFKTLTHRGRDKMAVIFQTTFSNAFSWMKVYKFRLRFHWCLFPRAQLKIFKHWFIYWLGAGQVTSHYLKQWWLVYWHVYASLGLNELIHF